MQSKFISKEIQIKIYIYQTTNSESYLAASFGAVDSSVEEVEGFGFIQIFILVEGLVPLGH